MWKRSPLMLVTAAHSNRNTCDATETDTLCRHAMTWIIEACDAPMLSLSMNSVGWCTDNRQLLIHMGMQPQYHQQHSLSCCGITNNPTLLCNKRAINTSVRMAC